MALTSFIPTLWAAAALEAFRPAEVVAPLTNREYQGLAQSGNKVTINALTIGDGTPVQNYATTRTHTVDDINSSSQDLLINQEKVIAFQVDDIDRVQAAGSFEPVVRDAAKHLSEDSESFIITTALTGGTNANPDTDGAGTDSPLSITTATATGTISAYDVVRKLRKDLTKVNVPAGDRWLVINPEFLDLLLATDSKLTSVDTAGSPEGLRNATVGRLLGFNLVESNMLANSDRPAALALHTSGLAYVNQIETVEGFRSHTSFKDVVRMLHVYGAKVVRPESVHYFLGAA